MSQPLTALECGLEVSLRRDKTAAQLRARVESALVAAKLLHQRLLEARVLQDAGEPGDTSVPVAAGQSIARTTGRLFAGCRIRKGQAGREVRIFRGSRE